MAMLSNKPLGILEQQNTATSEEIIIHASQHINQGSLWSLVRIAGAAVQKLWWHGKAYGTIFTVMLLTLVSMIFLGFHWYSRKLLSGFNIAQETVESTSK
ncbi:hypothetical protein H6G27_08315 [Nostoc linckia FACHB-104]|nr:hypothetical protein [Nostoc linckia FACHB-104]